MTESLDHQFDQHPVMEKIHELYHVLLDHDGFGELRMDIRILKRGQKEIILHCGKQYRFVVDVPQSSGQDQETRQETYELEAAESPRKGGRR